MLPLRAHLRVSGRWTEGGKSPLQEGDSDAGDRR